MLFSVSRSQHPTLNPKPQTLNPKPETRNPKPETRNPKPETDAHVVFHQQTFPTQIWLYMSSLSQHCAVMHMYAIHIHAYTPCHTTYMHRGSMHICDLYATHIHAYTHAIPYTCIVDLCIYVTGVLCHSPPIPNNWYSGIAQIEGIEGKAKP